MMQMAKQTSQLLISLENKLQIKEKECKKLQDLVEARKKGIQVQAARRPILKRQALQTFMTPINGQKSEAFVPLKVKQAMMEKQCLSLRINVGENQDQKAELKSNLRAPLKHSDMQLRQTSEQNITQRRISCK